MDAGDFLKGEFQEHRKVLQLTEDAVGDAFAEVVRVCTSAVDAGHKVLFFGNGGSAADAQHLAAELVVRYRENRAPISALALTTDTSALTAIGNDLGFEDVFARQVEALCDTGDVAIGMSTSGNSENVVRGLRAAKARGAVAVAFCGGDGGQVAALADHAIVVPSRTTARIQEMHILLGHALCDLLESARLPHPR